MGFMDKRNAEKRKYFGAESYKSIKRHICVTYSCYAFNSNVRKKEILFTLTNLNA